MKIYSPKDRVRVTVDGVSFLFSPLTMKQKAEVMGCLTVKSGNMVQDRWEMVRLALKYSLKGVEGLEDSEGKPWALALDSEGVAQESLDDLSNLSDKADLLFSAALQMTTGIPTQLIDGDGKPYEGVEVKLDPKR